MLRTVLFLFVFVQNLLAQVPQVPITRVEQMPNQPAPFNLRDWRGVALRYDSFTYDVNKMGQYLPLVRLQSGGVNYPQQPAFGLHTYVGTGSPNGNEAINVLPSLVGASLCGVDKQKQYGRDWIQMSQDFFAASNSQNLYLNNKGGGSGSDWWYDLMPNVYFYQLCDLYQPAPGSERERQFNSVAERFLASVRALGGNDAPWKKGNFDYRAFNFQTMQPNPNGVHEPEAAGAYAYILYIAYLKTGDPTYRKAAEWALEFLNEWGSNPSYELQLPYGTLTAARMNAEIGTRYDVGKLLNWSFERGPLRGWGTIVGNWGGFDVSGLVGEANNAGNDYAFQLNGVQQAAALVPMVRYDKRFARAMGKWVLNLVNATRLFYPGFLPANYQDATAWSNANDPGRVVGYEALRQKWQGLSPFSTGDAVNGGWAATNLSLYSTGSIGYLGALLEKTNVDKILKIDVLKTDFFKGTAYPTYLFFNPYNTEQTISFDAGSVPADLFDALSETFLSKNVSGAVLLSLPANGARLVSICPAGGNIVYERNKMLVNGVAVDFNQTAQAWQRPLRLQALSTAQTTVETGQKIALFSKTQVGDSPKLKHTWLADAGVLVPDSAMAQWTAPIVPGEVWVRLLVRDGNGLSDSASLRISVVQEINRPPQILSLLKMPAYATPGGNLQLECVAKDPNGDPMTFEWAFSGGNFSGTGGQVDWTAPNTAGIYQVKVTVRDNKGLSAERSTSLLVKNFDAVPSKLVAHYNFSNNTNDLTTNQLHGIPFSTAYVPDVFGTPQRALYFNGVNGRVTVPVQPALNFQEGITVSAWFRANDLPAKESFLLSHGSWQNRWKISFTPERHLRWTVNTLNTIGDLDTEIPLKTDSFYHVTATYDGQLLALYLNGTLHSFKSLSGKIRQTNLAFLMGQMLPTDAAYNFKGTLDEVKIFDNALNPDAVWALYQGASTGTTNAPAVQALELSPNPAQAQIWITYPATSAGMLQVFDTQGHLVWAQSGVSASLGVDIQSWPMGNYWVVLYANGQRWHGGFMKL